MPLEERAAVVRECLIAAGANAATLRRASGASPALRESAVAAASVIATMLNELLPRGARPSALSASPASTITSDGVSPGSDSQQHAPGDLRRRFDAAAPTAPPPFPAEASQLPPSRPPPPSPRLGDLRGHRAPALLGPLEERSARRAHAAALLDRVVVRIAAAAAEPAAAARAPAAAARAPAAAARAPEQAALLAELARVADRVVRACESAAAEAARGGVARLRRGGAPGAASGRGRGDGETRTSEIIVIDSSDDDSPAHPTDAERRRGPS
jgi:hypothetical protein